MLDFLIAGLLGLCGATGSFGNEGMSDGNYLIILIHFILQVEYLYFIGNIINSS